MFEKTNRRVSFTFRELHFTMLALNYYRDDLLAREGFTDVVDDLSYRLIKKGEGKPYVLERIEFDTLCTALMQWYKAQDPNVPDTKEAGVFILRFIVTPDRTGKTLYTLSDRKGR